MKITIVFRNEKIQGVYSDQPENVECVIRDFDISEEDKKECLEYGILNKAGNVFLAEYTNKVFPANELIKIKQVTSL
jgi:hypothetical protein